jgi:hypothetical protein
VQKWAIGAVSLALAALALWLCGWRFEPALSVQNLDPSGADRLIDEPAPLSWIPFHENAQISLKNHSIADATKLYVERTSRDPSYDGRVALSFYGKVVDEQSKPISGAKAILGWNTFGVAGGSRATFLSSDQNGLFSLIGQHGKILQVRVQKDGYYADNRGSWRTFEYANPSSPYWYEPDSEHPVVFQLRKKGPGVDLFSKHLTVPVFQEKYTKNQIDLRSGFIRPGILTIETDTSKFLPGAQPFPWSVKITMSEGGLIETDERFPFEAPSTGYVPSIDLNFSDLEQGHWQGGFTKTFYFYLPSTNTYGRMKIEASDSLPIEFDEVYNLHPGERNLEPREGSWTEKSSQESF